MIANNVTFGVNCTGNIQALTMCLSSVLMGEVVPARIQVRMEGAFPSFGNFYLEQLASLASIYGVEFSIEYAASKGVRKARNWQMEKCQTDFLWMGDDDCIYSYECLEYLRAATLSLVEQATLGPDFIYPFGYISGSKPDVNNRRGYGDFSVKILDPMQVKDDNNQFFNASVNQFYAQGGIGLAKTATMDTGNVLLNLPPIKKAGIDFDPFEASYNCGGEDTLMGLRLNHAGLLGYFCPNARAVHLEKPQDKVHFGEFAARGEMLRLACSKLGIDPDTVQKEFMPFLRKPE